MSPLIVGMKRTNDRWRFLNSESMTLLYLALSDWKSYTEITNPPYL